MTFQKQNFTRLNLQKLQNLIYMKHSTKCLIYWSITEIEFQILLESCKISFVLWVILMVYEVYKGVCSVLYFSQCLSYTYQNPTWRMSITRLTIRALIAHGKRFFSVPLSPQNGTDLKLKPSIVPFFVPCHGELTIIWFPAFVIITLLKRKKFQTNYRVSKKCSSGTYW